jgi:hypothetical protein
MNTILSAIPAPIWSLLTSALVALVAYLGGWIRGGASAKAAARADAESATIKAATDYEAIRHEVDDLPDAALDRAAGQWVRH